MKSTLSKIFFVLWSVTAIADIQLIPKSYPGSSFRAEKPYTWKKAECQIHEDVLRILLARQSPSQGELHLTIQDFSQKFDETRKMKPSLNRGLKKK